jgi:hypothetical protein
MIFYITSTILFGCLIFFGPNFFVDFSTAGRVLFFFEVVGMLTRIMGVKISYNLKNGEKAEIPV